MGCRGVTPLPGFGADSRSLNRRGGRWPRPPLVSLATFGRFALCATAHRADASLRCPKPCAAAQKSERCECPKGTRNAPRSTPPRISAQTARPSSTRRGRAASISKNIIIGKTRVSCSLRSLATLDGLCRRKRWRPPASSCIKPRFLRPGCSIIRASLPFANIGVLRAGRAQPLYLLTPSGRFAAFGGNSPPG